MKTKTTRTKKKKAAKAVVGNKELSAQVTQRFMMVMNEVIAIDKRNNGPCKTIKDFAASVGANASYIAQYAPPAQRNVTLELCCEVCRVHKINANWLLLGKGERYYNKIDADTWLKDLEHRLNAIEKAVTGKRK